MVRLCLVLGWLLACAWQASTGRAVAAERDGALCQAAIDVLAPRSPVPKRLLSAISLAESGRPASGGRVAAWPWTVNVGGVGTFYETADAAVAAVEALQATGVRSVDVGCMQVNLMHHPAAFASLRDAFDPALNAAYAARFLLQLHAETGDWSHAVGAYHSRTPELAVDYERRVVRAWPDAAAYGVAALPALELPAAGKPSGLTNPYGLQTPEFAARLRQAAADHAALTRKIVGDGPARTQLLSQEARPRLPGMLRLAQAAGGRGLQTMRR